MTILDKALATIDEKERAAIKNTWLGIQVSLGLDLKTILMWALPIGGGAVLIIVIIVAWNRRLGREIDDRKRAEALLAEKENLLRLAMNNMTDGMYMLDKDMNYLVFNEQYKELAGVGDNLVRIGAPMEPVIRTHAERGDYGEGDIGDIVRQRMEALASGDSVEREMELDGGLRIIDVRKAHVPGDGAIVTLSDITERKRAEARLAEKEAHLRIAMDNLPGGLAYTDDDMNVVVSNERLANMLDLMAPGKSYAEAIRYIAERGLFGPGDTDQLVEERLESLRNPPEHPLEVHSPDGHHFSVQRRKVEEGGVVTIATDITERLIAEAKLQDAYDVISSSIDYASNIQRSLLPPEQFLSENLAEHFVIWEPRDVVGGDLYWYRRCEGGFIIVLADCTGHGVPGAFMTMLSTGALDRALRDRPDGDPAQLIAVMNRSIKYSLRQDGGEGDSDDGLELGVCRIDSAGRSLVFAGARFSLFRVDGNSIDEIKGDKSGIGYRFVSADQVFTNHQLDPASGGTFYMTTDGLTDQIGGDKRRAFGKKRFIKLLTSAQGLRLDKQKERIVAGLNNYQGNEKRRDDVSVIGFRL